MSEEKAVAEMSTETRLTLTFRLFTLADMLGTPLEHQIMGMVLSDSVLKMVFIRGKLSRGLLKQLRKMRKGVKNQIRIQNHGETSWPPLLGISFGITLRKKRRVSAAPHSRGWIFQIG
jgi:hypothetical protein